MQFGTALTIESGTVRLSASALAQFIILGAIATSCIVFSEPAPVDLLLIGMLAALPLLGLGRPGKAATMVLALWCVHVACALLVALLSPNSGSAISHNLITLYLAAAGAVLAGWIGEDPKARFELVMRAYVIAATVAVIAGLTGYFRLLPGAFELFTNFGSARGTFKDPNVFGAAIAPALVYLTWKLLNAAPRRSAIAGGLVALVGIGLLLSFSRGAWMSAAVSLCWIGLFAIAGARTWARQKRLLIVMAAVGTGATILGGAALQHEGVSDLLAQRASVAQSYDVGSDGRFGGQTKALGLIAENPFGIGTHTFRERHHHEEVHNVLLSLFLNAGWIGGFAYLILVAFTLRIGIAQCLAPGPAQTAQIIATGAFLGLVVEGFVIDTDHWRHFFMLQALVLGLAHRAPQALPGTRTARITAPSGRGRRAAHLRAG